MKKCSIMSTLEQMICCCYMHFFPNQLLGELVSPPYFIPYAWVRDGGE